MSCDTNHLSGPNSSARALVICHQELVHDLVHAVDALGDGGQVDGQQRVVVLLGVPWSIREQVWVFTMVGNSCKELLGCK